MTCQSCGEPLRGRIDKRFCSDYCRAVNYNRLHAADNQLIRRIHYVLRANRNILKRLVGTYGERRIDREVLLSMGFRPEYMTGMVREPGSGHKYLCYDYGYWTDPDGNIRLIGPAGRDHSGT